MDPFLGEIKMVGFNFAPQGWALCDGSVLSIQQNTALFSLLGTTYGGNGTTNFALPDLRGRVPVHQGDGPSTSPYMLGQQGGAETVVLTTAQMPTHSHALAANSATGSATSPIGGFIASEIDSNIGAVSAFSPSSNGSMNAGAVAASGGSQAHNNLQPYLCVNFIIALQGIFPPRP
jgi:microcystin-dependent protein